MDFEICAQAPRSWKRLTIEDVCTRITSGGTPSRRNSEFFINGTIPWVKTQELQDGWIQETEEKITEEALRSSSAKLLPPNTVMLAMYGATVGQLGILRSSMTCNQACCALIVDENIADFRYVYYLLRLHREVIKGLATGAAQQNLSAAQIKQFKFAFPDIETQTRVADALSTLDDKIDLNRRINQTLEAMAQAIFKSWFVDFDPVKAKIAAIEQGQDPLRAAMRAISGKTDAELDQMPREHHDQLAATAALFPDAMEDAAQGSANAASAGRAGAASELGEIPKGWTVGTLDDLCHLNPESWSAKTLPNTVWYVDLANAKGGEISEVQILGEKNIPSRGRRILRYGDTIVGTVRPGNRSFALIGEDGFTGSTGFAVLRPKTPYWLEFVYLVATSETNIERLAHLADGGAYPAVRPEIVVQEDVVIPTQSVAQAFHQHVQPLFSKILVNRKCKKYLENLRDTLLPKLLSGELSVADVDKEAALS